METAKKIGRPAGATNKKPISEKVRMQLVLTPEEAEIAKALGGGMVSRGIRRALKTLEGFSKTSGQNL